MSFETPLLATKMRVPPQPHHVVRRPQLVNLLESELPHYKLILLAAPAGYGKTTLLSQWSQTAHYSVSWLSLSEEDNNLPRFFRYLLTGWEQIQPEIGDTDLALLLSGASSDEQILLSAFINAAIDLTDHLVFVLDDYHLITDPSIHQSLTFLLDHLPPLLHFVLACRGEPPLPLARYRARQELLELPTQTLSFQLEETADYLTKAMGFELSSEAVQKLQDQLEGWVAGIQLAALSRQYNLSEAADPTISGRHRFIADYLSQDVLAQLPIERRHFLLQTSILGQLNSSLCHAVTAKADSQERLESLERDNLFLTALDADRTWFRYHPVFADFLRERLERSYPQEVTILHRRAAAWYLAQDLSQEAFDHALAGEDMDLVAQIIERFFPGRLLAGELNVVTQWVETIPDKWYKNLPVVGLAEAGVLLFTGRLEACADRLDEIEELTVRARPDQEQQMAKVAAMRCSIACFQNNIPQAEALGREALKHLPEDDLSFQPVVYGALGDTYRSNGRWQEAKDCYLKLLDFSHSPAFQTQAAHVYGALADLDLRQGHLKSAAAYWKKALATTQKRENWGSFPLPVIGWVYLRMAELLYEWNDLEEALDHLTPGLERVELGGDV
ncbi:MAG: hypothetical protein WAM60_13645, partial [Candidatus Promineifilaceae bacterium]